MQPGCLPLRLVVRLPRDTRHIHPQSPGNDPDKRRAGRNRARLDLRQEAVRHVSTARQLAASPAPRLADHGYPRASPVLISHSAQLPDIQVI